MAASEDGGEKLPQASLLVSLHVVSLLQAKSPLPVRTPVISD